MDNTNSGTIDEYFASPSQAFGIGAISGGLIGSTIEDISNTIQPYKYEGFVEYFTQAPKDDNVSLAFSLGMGMLFLGLSRVMKKGESPVTNEDTSVLKDHLIPTIALTMFGYASGSMVEDLFNNAGMYDYSSVGLAGLSLFLGVARYINDTYYAK